LIILVLFIGRVGSWGRGARADVGDEDWLRLTGGHDALVLEISSLAHKVPGELVETRRDPGLYRWFPFKGTCHIKTASNGFDLSSSERSFRQMPRNMVIQPVLVARQYPAGRELKKSA
jgi:hypothetical protein